MFSNFDFLKIPVFKHWENPLSSKYIIFYRNSNQSSNAQIHVNYLVIFADVKRTFITRMLLYNILFYLMAESSHLIWSQFCLDFKSYCAGASTTFKLHSESFFSVGENSIILFLCVYVISQLFIFLPKYTNATIT